MERVLSKYRNSDDSLIKDFDITHIPVPRLKEILQSDPNDEMVQKVYQLNGDQLSQISKFIQEPLLDEDEDPKSVEFFYECFRE